MIHVGTTAATLYFYLEIPIFVRGLSQSMSSTVGPAMRMTAGLYDELQNVDPNNPTGIVGTYYRDWWNFEEEWKTHPAVVDLEEAYKWHIRKVCNINKQII
jgi:hypothetical protein